jgi:ferrous iron transport protein A
MDNSNTLVSLAELNAGEHAVLVSLQAGRGAAGRLSALGFTPGVEMTMVQNYGRGPLVVSVRDTRIALGRREASAIYIQRRGS